ncbi:type I methionyl aminopeptidase [Candidatus Foliamicus sp.]
MQVTIKTAEEQERMRVAGRLAAEVLDMIEAHVRPGISTDELDGICHRYITEQQQAIPAPLNYRGFPRSICTSLNQVVCHGIPGKRLLRDGDMLNIDITVIKDGFHGDTSRIFHVGRPRIKAQRLARITFEAMWAGIRQIGPGARLGDIGHAIQTVAEAQGLSVVREYCGHGIGRVFHEPPNVLHYGQPATGMTLQEGMTITVEPMLNEGRPETRLLPDGWTVVTRDRKLSAQWEHTVLVTADGYEVLTLGAGPVAP